MWNEEEDAEYNNEASAAWIAVKSNAEQARLGVKEEAGVEDDDEEGGAGAVARWSKRGQPFCQVCAGQGGVPPLFFVFWAAAVQLSYWQRVPPPSCALQPVAGWLFSPNAVGRCVGTPNLHTLAGGERER